MKTNRIGIDIDYIYNNLGGFNKENMRDAIKLCSKHGFTQLDFRSPLYAENYIDVAKFWRDEIEKNGLKVHQSHAPFFHYNPEKTLEEYKDALSRSIDVSVALGSKYLVVHGDEYRVKEGEVYDPEKVLAFCRELFSPYVERANKCGLSIAFENLCENKADPHFCSDVDELISLATAFGKDSGVSVCWDFGHGNYTYGERAIDAFKKAFPLISCTHMHDNLTGIYRGDDHSLPLLGLMDWKAYMSYMRENGYKGNYTLELVYGHIPRELMDPFLSFSKDIVEYLMTL